MSSKSLKFVAFFFKELLVFETGKSNIIFSASLATKQMSYNYLYKIESINGAIPENEMVFSYSLSYYE